MLLNLQKNVKIRGNFDYSRITVGRMDQNEKMVGIIKKIIESGELKKI